MRSAFFTPEQDLHFVLCDFGRSGQAYVETDPSQADACAAFMRIPGEKGAGRSPSPPEFKKPRSHHQTVTLAGAI